MKVMMIGAGLLDSTAAQTFHQSGIIGVLVPLMSLMIMKLKGATPYLE